MTRLALPGRKAETLAWMQALLGDLGLPDTPIRRYGFWSRPDRPDPDIAPEVEAVAASGADVVIAKSIGCLIALLARRDRGFTARAYADTAALAAIITAWPPWR